MTDTVPPGRAAARFLDKSAGEVSLPGYLNPIPSIVAAGDVFTFEAEFAGDVLVEGGRFEEASLDDARTPSPNEDLTKPELGAKLGLDEATVRATAKGDLVDLADELDRQNPTPPSGEGDDTEGTDQ